MADEQPTTEFEPAVETGSATSAGGQSPLGVGSRRTRSPSAPRRSWARHSPAGSRSP